MNSSQAAAAPVTFGAPEATEPTEPTEPTDQVRAPWLQRRLEASIVFYQRAREGRLSPCRFFPSCSAYGLESIQVHGTWRGGWLTVRRLLRCRPLGPSGFDPVPERKPSANHTDECGLHTASTTLSTRTTVNSVSTPDDADPTHSPTSTSPTPKGG